MTDYEGGITMVRKALVVDDDEMILYLLQYVLESNGYNITRATDGDQAIKLIQAEEFDLVVTDLEMGRTSGFEVIRNVKKINSRSIAVMITGSCESSDEDEAFRQGADDYLLKPFSLGSFLEHLHYQELKYYYLPAAISQREQRAGDVSG